MRKTLALAVGLIAGVAVSATGARADAIIRSQAMLASTIAEFFITEDGVAVELEIGLEDIAAFGNILPDEIYEKLDGPPLPSRERLERFFRHDFTIEADDGPPLEGRLVEIGPRPRIQRDDITGEPLADPDAEQIAVFARLEYRLESRPRASQGHPSDRYADGSETPCRESRRGSSGLRH